MPPLPPIGPVDPELVVNEIDAQAEADRVADEKRRHLEQDQALLKRWTDAYNHARQHDSEARKVYARHRAVARGDTGWLVDTNLVGAILEILMAFIYAKDPDVSIKPSSAVGVTRMPQMALVAKTMETVVSSLLRFAGLKRQAKRWIRSGMTIGIGWFKAGIQTKMGPDPVMETRLNSLQDNLRRLTLLQQQVDDGDVRDEDAALAEIRGQIEATQAGLEREFADGAVIDFIAGEDIQVAPECGELENYLSAPWISFDSYKSREDARALCEFDGTDEEFNAAFKSANLYAQRPRKGEDGNTSGGSAQSQWSQITSNGEAEAQFGFLKIIEIWSMRDGQVFTLVEGVARWARKPYAPRTGSRFYPFFQIAFHYVDSERHPQSDVQLLEKLQDEYGRTRSNFAEHRRRAIPATLFDETQIDAKTMDRIKASENNEFIAVSTTNSSPMQNAFYPKPYPQVDQALYDTNPIRVDMEKMSGAQDAQQGSVAVEKTLGEAEIQQSGFMARTGARKDAVEDALTELSQYMTELALQILDTQDAIRYAGPDAVWVKLSVEEALTFFSVEVKAGSTGKPSKSIDKQTWGTLLPLLQQLIDRIGQARLAGEEWAAKPWIGLLRETAQRLDDRIDVDALLPVPPPESVTKPAPPPPDPLAEAKADEANQHAFLYRAQGLAALAMARLPLTAADNPQQSDPDGGMAAIAPLLASLTGGGGNDSAPLAPPTDLPPMPQE